MATDDYQLMTDAEIIDHLKTMRHLKVWKAVAALEAEWKRRHGKVELSQDSYYDRNA